MVLIAKNYIKNLFIILALFLNLTAVSAQEIQLVNTGFELPATGISVRNWDQIDGWNTETNGASGVMKNEYYSPVDGEWFAFQKGGDGIIYQETDHTILAGKTYSLQLWARSINSAGNAAKTTLEIRLYTNDNTIVTVTADVNVPRLKGAAAVTPNDDGANVWIDGGYRHQFADKHLIQPLTDDPIEDEWTIFENSGYEAVEGLGWAVGPVIAGDQKYVYGTLYQDNPANFYSSIPMIKVLATKGLDYTWSKPITFISHSGTEFPWVEDPHCYYDEAKGRLWMVWGGGTCYISELDPETGLFKNHQTDPEFDTHPDDLHIPVATWPETREGWNGDAYSVAWMEGAALYKHNGYWYFFGSYGHLGKDYTIRYGRGDSPTGPFYDQHGVNMMAFDAQRNKYGNTILLGDEGEQRVPGHPHLWEEGGKTYMGYDFRKKPGEEMDYMGIRRLFWINDWPTIWTPVSVVFNSDDYPTAIGKKLNISFGNIGHEDSRMGVDCITIQISEGTD